MVSDQNTEDKNIPLYKQLLFGDREKGLEQNVEAKNIEGLTKIQKPNTTVKVIRNLFLYLILSWLLSNILPTFLFWILLAYLLYSLAAEPKKNTKIGIKLQNFFASKKLSEKCLYAFFLLLVCPFFISIKDASPQTVENHWAPEGVSELIPEEKSGAEPQAASAPEAVSEPTPEEKICQAAQTKARWTYGTLGNEDNPIKSCDVTEWPNKKYGVLITYTNFRFKYRIIEGLS